MTNAKPEGQPLADEGHSTIAVSAEAENEMYSKYTKDTLRITYTGPEGKAQEMECLHTAGTGNNGMDTTQTFQCATGQEIEQPQSEITITSNNAEPVLKIPHGLR